MHPDVIAPDRIREVNPCELFPRATIAGGRRMRSAIVWTCVAMLVLLAGLSWTGLLRQLTYRPARFAGDGVISDGGFWSYPRYVVRFPQHPLAPGTHEYRCSGLPANPMMLTLRLEPHKVAAAKIKGETLSIRARILDARGRTLCEVDEPVARWTLNWSVDQAQLWHERLELSPQHASDVRIQLTYTEATPSTSSPANAFSIQPILSGGGNEPP